MTAIHVNFIQLKNGLCFTSSELNHVSSVSVLTVFHLPFNYFYPLTCVEREQT